MAVFTIQHAKKTPASLNWIGLNYHSTRQSEGLPSFLAMCYGSKVESVIPLFTKNRKRKA